jgi:hypothetical protein
MHSASCKFLAEKLTRGWQLVFTIQTSFSAARKIPFFLSMPHDLLKLHFHHVLPLGKYERRRNIAQSL